MAASSSYALRIPVSGLNNVNVICIENIVLVELKACCISICNTVMYKYYVRVFIVFGSSDRWFRYSTSGLPANSH